MRLVALSVATMMTVWAASNALAQPRGNSDVSRIGTESLTPFISQGEFLKPNGSFYLGGYKTSRNGLAVVVHLYEHREGVETDTPTWLPWAIRIIGNSTDQRMEWAEGQDCPAIYGVQQMLSDFPGPRFQRPRFNGQLPAGARILPGPPITLDAGATVAIWGYSTQADGGMGTMTITGRDGMIQSWAQFAEDQMEPCWKIRTPQTSQSDRK